MHVIFLLQDIPALDVINLSANSRLSLLRCLCVCVCVCVYVSVCVCERERKRESARASEQEIERRETDSICGFTYMARMRVTHTSEDITLKNVVMYVLHHKSKQHNDIISFNTVQ
jgi:hypothetical protein